MNDYVANRKKRINIIAGIILFVGLSSAALIYLGAENEPDLETTYPFKLEDSKRYIHDLELYGGKANLIASDFRSWLDGLWVGKKLAFTVAWTTFFAFAAFLFLANRWNPEPRQASPGRKNHERK